MLTDLGQCPGLDVPWRLMQHVVAVESSFNPHAIGVVGARLERQPQSLAEAVAMARMLDAEGRDFSLGLAQVNRRNLRSQGLQRYEDAFDACLNLRAGSRILAQCHRRYPDWGQALSCYYAGNPRTGYAHGYVQKIVQRVLQSLVAGTPDRAAPDHDAAPTLLQRRMAPAPAAVPGTVATPQAIPGADAAQRDRVPPGSPGPAASARSPAAVF